MNCKWCGKGVQDGVVLYRQNEKGVPGIWACLKCIEENAGVQPDSEVKDLAEIISNGGPIND